MGTLGEGGGPWGGMVPLGAPWKGGIPRGMRPKGGTLGSGERLGALARRRGWETGVLDDYKVL